MPALGAVPAWPKPPPAGEAHSAVWIRQANRFAEFALATFWPWPAPERAPIDGRPGRFDYVDEGGEPCEAWQMFAWKLEELTGAPGRYDDEIKRIDR